MATPNFLIVATNDDVPNLENVTYLYPLKGYCVGFLKEFEFNQIKDVAYLLINRLLDTSAINNLKELLKKIPPNIKGIVFEDLGVYELIKDFKIAKILYATHANCSYQTINCYLKYVDSLIISPDIPKEEIKKIIAKSNKPLIGYGMGHLPCMYSRRTLISNYGKHFNYPVSQVLNLKESVTHIPFFAVENEYGTVIYDDKVYLANFLKDEKLMSIFINPLFIDEAVANLISFFLNDQIEGKTKRFLEHDTIYSLDKEGDQNGC